VHKHGDGVKRLARWVDDARKAFKLAGARRNPAYEPRSLVDENGEVAIAGIHIPRRDDSTLVDAELRVNSCPASAVC
jgi:hypothetical protein